MTPGERDSREGTKAERGIQGVYAPPRQENANTNDAGRKVEKKPLTHKVLERRISTPLRKDYSW
jgi:hypothetical protein